MLTTLALKQLDGREPSQTRVGTVRTSHGPPSEQGVLRNTGGGVRKVLEGHARRGDKKLGEPW